jgi:hypothetical protein
MNSVWKRGRTCGVGVALLLTLCACSPIEDGKVGITRDEAGHLVGLALPCKGKLDGAGLYRDDDPNAQTLTVLAKWSRRDATPTLLRWNLGDAASTSWSTSDPLADEPLADGHTYLLDAVGEQQKWSTEDLRFTAADLAPVTTGTILTTKSDATSGEVVPTLVPVSEFLGSACSGDPT